MKIRILFVGLSLAFLSACGTKQDPLLQEAAQVHNQAIAVHDEVMKQLEDAQQLTQKLKARRESADSTGRAAIDGLIAEMDSSQKAMDTWMNEVVEVPGEEGHNHSHVHKKAENHDHAHDHAAQPEVTPQQMLDIQKEMKKNIEKIQADLTQQMEAAKKML